MYSHEFVKNDAYRDVFATVIYLLKTFRQKGCIADKGVCEKIKANFSGSQKLLQTAVELTWYGAVDSIFKFFIEFEFNNIVRSNPEIAEAELFELTLTKELVHYLRINDPDSIYCLLTYVCSSSVKNELTPTIDWVDVLI